MSRSTTPAGDHAAKPPPARAPRRPRPLKNTQTQSVTQTLRMQVLNGEFAPGSHLQEEGLAARLGTSRTPVRAALAALAQELLLIYQPNRGYQVPRFTLDEILKAYDVRGALEGAAARMLAEAGLPVTVERQMRDCIQTVDAMLEKGRLLTADQGSWRDMNVRFHNAIQLGIENRFLSEVLEQMRNIPMVSNALVQWYDYETVSRYHAEHHSIFEAIAARQGARAEALMREHIYRAREFVRRTFATAPGAAQSISKAS